MLDFSNRNYFSMGDDGEEEIEGETEETESAEEKEKTGNDEEKEFSPAGDTGVSPDEEIE